MGPQWDELRRVEAPRRGVRAALPDQVQDEIYRLCVIAASAVLKQHGRETMTLDEARAATLGVVDALSEALGDVPNPMVADGNQRAGLAQLYESALDRMAREVAAIERIDRDAAISLLNKSLVKAVAA